MITSTGTREDAALRLTGRLADQERALRRAFDEHYVRLVRMALLLTGDRETAEDLVQEAFARSARALPGLSEERSGLYLRKTVANLWKNLLRRRSIERRHGGRLWVRQVEDPRGETDERVVLLAALRRLPPRQRACVVLRFYEDMTETEVAEVMSCSVGTVKSQTSRAVAKLREELLRDG